ncbi:MAG: hypothetical protein FWD90_08585 [Defluviitaleaceae bacterium]|nr:hypothetical protein [Defluviitaleaceae bacterium]
MRDLKIHPEFSRIIPPLSREEYTALEQDIAGTGRCREAILTWRGFIVDGHNRYAICRAHGVPFRTEGMRFSDEAEAIAWIVDHQLGRRNLSDAARIELALQNRRYVRKDIARAAQLSEQTVRHYIKVKELADGEVLRKVKSGEEKIHSAYRKLVAEVVTVETLFDIRERGDDWPGYAKLCKLYGFLLKHVGLWSNADGAERVWEGLNKLRKRQHNQQHARQP